MWFPKPFRLTVRQLESISIEYKEPNNPNQFRHLISPHSDAVIPWREDHQASHCTSRTRNSPRCTDNSSTRKFLDYTEVRLPELPDPLLCGPFLLSLAPPPPAAPPALTNWNSSRLCPRFWSFLADTPSPGHLVSPRDLITLLMLVTHICSLISP